MTRPGPLVLLALLVVLVLASWTMAATSAGATEAAAWDLVHWTVSSLGATVLAGIFWKRSRPGSAGALLRFWGMLGLGANALGQLLYDLHVLSGQTGLPWLSGVAYVLFGPLVLAGFARSWTSRPGQRRLAGIGLDALVLTLGLVALLLSVLIPAQVGLDAASVASLVVFPSTIFAAFSYGIVLIFHDGGRSWLPARMGTFSCLLAVGLSQMLWGQAALNGGARPGSWLNLVSSLAVLGLGASLGGWVWSRRTQVEGLRASLLVLVPVAGLLAFLAALFFSASDHRMPAWALPLFGSIALPLGLLSLIRQVLLVQSLDQGRRDAARSVELAEALGRLQQTQDHLIRSAKLAALGQIVAGISHDLNTPLAAIRSASALLQELGPGGAATGLEAWNALDEAGRTQALNLLASLSPDQEFLDSRAERKLRRQLADQAEAAGHPDGEVLAQGLVDAGLGQREDLSAALWAYPRPGAVLRAVEPFAATYRLASVVHQASGKASDVVQALHNFLRGGSETQRQSVDVADSLREVLPLFQYRGGKGLEVSARLAPGAVVLAWPDKLSQVWVNLLSNAVQAAGPAGRVELAARVQGAWVVVQVTDNGPGVPPEVGDRIFEAFYTTKPQGEGSGLGLDVCRRVVAELGGSIAFESVPGQTVFTVRLPFEPY